MSEKIETRLTIDDSNNALKASLILAEHTGLSQAKIKDAMHKGAVWLSRADSKKRLRRASKSLNTGDVLELNYNPELLQQVVPEPQLVHDAQHYSIWFKPYGLYCQGSRWGDFASINRWVEIHLADFPDSRARPVFLVHRLDRATTGLILLCHSKTAATKFSGLFKDRKISKRYQGIVEGDCSHFPNDFEINTPVEDKPANTVFSCIANNSRYSLLDIELLSGRKHQIRQHLGNMGYPIVGDRLYGNTEATDTSAAHTKNLQLQAVSLEFICPFSEEKKHYSVPDDQRIGL